MPYAEAGGKQRQSAASQENQQGGCDDEHNTDASAVQRGVYMYAVSHTMRMYSASCLGRSSRIGGRGATIESRPREEEDMRGEMSGGEIAAAMRGEYVGMTLATNNENNSAILRGWSGE